MKTKNFTLTLWSSRAITFTLWEDLSVAKMSKMNVILGFERAKNTRLNAMERVDTLMLTIGPVACTYSKGFLRKGEEVLVC